MKSTLVIAGLILALATPVIAQEGHTSTPRRTKTTAKKTSSSTTRSAGSKKETATTSSAPVATASEGMTSTPRREAPASSQPAASQPTSQPTSSHVDRSTPMQIETNRIESWYGYYGVGYAKPSYPGVLQSEVEELRASSEITNAGVAMDAAGVYTPVGGTHLIVGGVVNLSIDTYLRDDRSVTLTQTTVASSALYFADRIGQGFFLRGDVGVASLAVSSSMGDRLDSPIGLGTLAGVGYAVPLSSETRLLTNVNYSARIIDGDTYDAFGVTVGVLF